MVKVFCETFHLHPKIRTMKAKETKEPQKWAKHTDEQKNQARKYYLIGLNLSEIGKLLDTPVRTLEKWQAAEKWTELKQVRGIEQRAYELHEGGKTFEEISKILEISRTTAHRYIKRAKEFEK